MAPCLSIAVSTLGVEQGLRMEVEYLSPVLKDLRGVAYEGVLTSAEKASSCLSRVVLVATGGTEETITSLAEKSRIIHLLYIEEYNSLPAVIEAVGYLRASGRNFFVEKLQGSEHVRGLLQRLELLEKTFGRLKGARLGLVGGVSPWLVYSRVDPLTLRERVGAELVEISLEELVKVYNSTRNVAVPKELVARALEVRIPGAELEKAYRLYLALMKIVEERRLDGLTIKCFDIIKELDTTACLALSLLNTNGFPAACEGDVPLLVSMLLGEWATGQPAFMANPAIIREDSVLFAHCTAPLTSTYSLMTHFESGRGVGIRVDYPAGEKVTIFRVNPGLDTIRIFTGTIVDAPWSERHCRTQVRVKISQPKMILERSIGNHYALILGDHLQELSILASLLGLNLEIY
jgi:L-fucose isomerase-like protein